MLDKLFGWFRVGHVNPVAVPPEIEDALLDAAHRQQKATEDWQEVVGLLLQESPRREPIPIHRKSV